jgi:DNA-binding MarR family transcriptional regulator
MAVRLDPADERYIERVGRLFEADGAPRIAGRMLGLMMLASDPLSLEEISERLRVSKASASTNARQLETWGVLERATRPGDRRDYYRMADDLGARLVEARLERMRKVEALLEEGTATPAARDPGVLRRLRAITALHAQALACLEATVRRLREELPAAESGAARAAAATDDDEGRAIALEDR